jgi:hypothetical protein
MTVLGQEPSSRPYFGTTGWCQERTFVKALPNNLHMQMPPRCRGVRSGPPVGWRVCEVHVRRHCVRTDLGDGIYHQVIGINPLDLGDERRHRLAEVDIGRLEQRLLIGVGGSFTTELSRTAPPSSDHACEPAIFLSDRSVCVSDSNATVSPFAALSRRNCSASVVLPMPCPPRTMCMSPKVGHHPERHPLR